MSKEIFFTFAEDAKPLIPEGDYDVMFARHEIKPFIGGKKLYLTFEVIDLGQYQGVLIFRAYNYYEKIPRGSDLFKDLVFLSGKRGVKNAKFSTKLFENKVIRARIRTVKLDRKQTSLQTHQQYSVIDKLLSVEVGGEV